MNRQQTGIQAEETACRHLQYQGLRLLSRNYRCRGGEIDLIMRDGDSLVFVEVRYRRHDRYGSGAESVDLHKQGRIIRCAHHYLQRHPAEQRRPARFDVVSLDARRGLQWIRNAFSA
jgi:putative endonuclease